MMSESRAKRICIFLVIALILVFVAIRLFRVPSDDLGIEGKQTTEQMAKEEVRPSSVEGYAFRIAIEEDYLVVYKTTDTEAYFYTDICTTSLPEEVLETISRGITFSTEKELYDFLENYSS